ncbi:pectate lyase [Duganella sp. Root1480D1]|uniref:pectate lyase n=1 Tax=Duganella sp. Root1480D1 TaxID=1736471 RepID=UPI000A5CF959|nr:pectate lyase [Duganella sp. Root1480D1]
MRRSPASAAKGLRFLPEELAREAAAAAILRIVLTAALAGAAASLPLPAEAALIGYMTPAEPLTEARIATVPDLVRRLSWQAYLTRSQAAMAADKAALSAERKPGETAPPASSPGSVNSMPLKRSAGWYATAQARRIADNIVSFQTPAGGWGKNADRSGQPRRRGQAYVAAEGKESWAFVGTIDNGATTTELQFLARVQASLPGEEGIAYRASALKGIRYLLDAQYPNGGWPQVYPLQGGYHDAITFNDDAMVAAIEVLRRAADRDADYAFVPPALALEAQASAERGIAAILASQVTVDGTLTAWCQQHDAITLAPVGARNFEPAALASAESVGILQLLKRLPKQAPQAAAAVSAGIAWLRSTALPAPGGGRQWARFYGMATMKPIFGDRDRSIHDKVGDLSPERRSGYAWYVTNPTKLLDEN